MITQARGRNIVRPNLFAAIVASVGIMLGSISPWVVFLGIGLSGTNGDGLITLVLGVIAAMILAANLSTGSRELPWMWWLPPVIGVVCLLLSAYNAITFSTLEADSELVDAVVEVGWGLWLVLLSSIVLCVTASVAAANSRRSIGEALTGRSMSPTTRLVVLGAAVLAMLLLVAVIIARMNADGFSDVGALGGAEQMVTVLVGSYT